MSCIMSCIILDNASLFLTYENPDLGFGGKSEPWGPPAHCEGAKVATGRVQRIMFGVDIERAQSCRSVQECNDYQNITYAERCQLCSAEHTSHRDPQYLLEHTGYTPLSGAHAPCAMCSLQGAEQSCAEPGETVRHLKKTGDLISSRLVGLLWYSSRMCAHSRSLS